MSCFRLDAQTETPDPDSDSEESDAEDLELYLQRPFIRLDEGLVADCSPSFIRRLVQPAPPASSTDWLSRFHPQVSTAGSLSFTAGWYSQLPSFIRRLVQPAPSFICRSGQVAPPALFTCWCNRLCPQVGTTGSTSFFCRLVQTASFIRRLVQPSLVVLHRTIPEVFLPHTQ